jgi:SOS-response transcriptional repressor LexA
MVTNLNPLTDQQKKVLVFMHQFFSENDQLPTMQAIAEGFGWKSFNAAAEVAIKLEAKGYLERNALNKFKFTRDPVRRAEVASFFAGLPRPKQFWSQTRDNQS